MHWSSWSSQRLRWRSTPPSAAHKFPQETSASPSDQVDDVITWVGRKNDQTLLIMCSVCRKHTIAAIVYYFVCPAGQFVNVLNTNAISENKNVLAGKKRNKQCEKSHLL